MLCSQRPVKPTRFVILAVGVIVAVLRSPHLISHQEHRESKRNHRRGQEILHQAIAQLLDRRIIRWAFDPQIVAPVVVRPVAIILAIRFVVFRVVRDEIVEGKTVVTCDEINAFLSLSPLMSVDLRAAEEPVSEGTDETAIPTKKTAHVVAKPPVPFPPLLAGEATHLI